MSGQAAYSIVEGFEMFLFVRDPCPFCAAAAGRKVSAQARKSAPCPDDWATGLYSRCTFECYWRTPGARV